MAKKKTKKSKAKTKKATKVKKVVKAKKKSKDKVVTLPAVVEEIDIVEVDIVKKPDSYEEHACGFVNEAECEEDLEEDGLDLEDVEKEHFNKDEEE